MGSFSAVILASGCDCFPSVVSGVAGSRARGVFVLVVGGWGARCQPGAGGARRAVTAWWAAVAQDCFRFSVSMTFRLCRVRVAARVAPDAVRVQAAQRQVPQPGVLGAPDPVLGAGPSAAAQLQVRQLAAAGVGGEGGDS